MKKKKSKIAIITECPYVGVFKAIDNLGCILNDIGFEIIFVLPQIPRNRYGQKQKDQEKKLLKYGSIKYLPLRRKYRYLIFDFIKYLSFLKRERFNIVISFTEYAGKLSRLCYLMNRSSRYYHSHQCVDVYRKKGFEFYIELFIEKSLKNLTDYYIACGPSEVSILIERINVRPEKILFLPNFNELSILKNTKKEYDYVYVGRMVDIKGISKVLQIFKELGLSSQLVCIGEGPQLEHFKKIYDETKFLGYLPYDDVLKTVTKSKFIVSYSEIEGLPYSVLEAMSLGVVPIVSRVPGHSDLVLEGVNGFTFCDNVDFREVLFKSSILDSCSYSKISNSSKVMLTRLARYSKLETKKHFNQYV